MYCSVLPVGNGSRAVSSLQLDMVTWPITAGTGRHACFVRYGCRLEVHRHQESHSHSLCPRGFSAHTALQRRGNIEYRCCREYCGQNRYRENTHGRLGSMAGLQTFELYVVVILPSSRANPQIRRSISIFEGISREYPELRTHCIGTRYGRIHSRRRAVRLWDRTWEMSERCRRQVVVQPR